MQREQHSDTSVTDTEADHNAREGSVVVAMVGRLAALGTAEAAGALPLVDAVIAARLALTR